VLFFFRGAVGFFGALPRAPRGRHPTSGREAKQKTFASFFFWRLEAQKKNQKNARARGDTCSATARKTEAFSLSGRRPDTSQTFVKV
jgi:hypothetical protein